MAISELRPDRGRQRGVPRRSRRAGTASCSRRRALARWSGSRPAAPAQSTSRPAICHLPILNSLSRFVLLEGHWPASVLAGLGGAGNCRFGRAQPHGARALRGRGLAHGRTVSGVGAEGAAATGRKIIAREVGDRDNKTCLLLPRRTSVEKQPGSETVYRRLPRDERQVSKTSPDESFGQFQIRLNLPEKGNSFTL